MDLEEINHLLARVDCIRQLRLSLSPDPYMPDPVYHYDLELELFDPDSSANVELIFRDIAELRTPHFQGLTQLCLFQVELVHESYERRYRAVDIDHGMLRFSFKSLEIFDAKF